MSDDVKKGVLYIGFGDHFVKEMLFSAESVKVHNPNIHITAFVDRPIESEFIDSYRLIKINHLRPKVDYIAYTPYDQTVFLDTDTIVNHDLTEMYDLLHKYEFAICHDMARKRDNVSALIPEYSEIPYSFSEVNPGVMVFSKTKNVVSFFENWKKLFYKHFNSWPYEQPTFRVALWQSDMSFYIMPIEYNVRDERVREKAVKMHAEFGKDHLKPRVYHMHADTGINQEKYNVDSLEQALEFCKNNYMKY